MVTTVMTMSLVVRLKHRDLPEVTQLVKVRDRMKPRSIRFQKHWAPLCTHKQPPVHLLYTQILHASTV